MWWKEILKTVGLVSLAIVILGALGIIFMELVDLLARFIMWLGPNPFFIWLL